MQAKQRGTKFEPNDPRLARPMCPLWTCCNDDFFDLPELLASVRECNRNLNLICRDPQDSCSTKPSQSTNKTRNQINERICRPNCSQFINLITEQLQSASHECHYCILTNYTRGIICVHSVCCFQVCAAEKDFALLEKLQKNVPSVRLRRPCRHCEDGAVNITAKLLKARSETPDMPMVNSL